MRGDGVKLSITTSIYRATPLHEALRRLCDYGFDAVELTAIPHPYEGHIEATRTSQAELDELRARLDGLCMEVSAITSGPLPPLASENDLRYLSLSFEMAERLSAPVVITYVTGGHQWEDLSEERWRPVLVETFRRCADEAEARGVRLALETEPGLLIANPYDGLSLIREVNHPNFGYNFCIPHIVPVIEESDTLENVVRQAGGLIFNTHLADVEGRVHKHTLPGEGEVDFPALFAHLGEVGYEGYFTFDLYPYADRADVAARKVAETMKRFGG